MKLYCGIDLHSNNHWLTIIDEQDGRLVERRLPNDLSVTLRTLEPYRSALSAITVESTFNWYWLVDGLSEAGHEVKLVNTSAVRQYDGLKHADDRHDAFHWRICSTGDPADWLHLSEAATVGAGSAASALPLSSAANHACAEREKHVCARTELRVASEILKGEKKEPLATRQEVFKNRRSTRTIDRLSYTVRFSNPDDVASRTGGMRDTPRIGPIFATGSRKRLVSTLTRMNGNWYFIVVRNVKMNDGTKPMQNGYRLAIGRTRESATLARSFEREPYFRTLVISRSSRQRHTARRRWRLAIRIFGRGEGVVDTPKIMLLPFDNGWRGRHD